MPILPENRNNRRVIANLLLIVIVAMITALSHPVVAAGEEKLSAYEGVGRSMGVEFRIVLYAADDDRQTAATAMKKAFDRIDELNAIFSDYDPKSEVSRASRSSGSDAFVETSEELWQLMSVTRSLNQQTDGAFDVTVGPLSQLWRDAIKAKKLPDDADVKSAVERSGLRFVEFDDKAKSMKLTRENMRLDFGGIAKGYAADQALAILRESGFPIAFVDGSGDIAIGDAPPGRDGWRVQVAAIEKKELASTILVLKDCGVATSGEQYQFLEANGKRYSHIVDPRSGYGVIGRSSATVIAANATTADALASAAGVLGAEKFTKRITCDSVHVLVQTDVNGKVVSKMSEKFEAFLKK